MATLALGIGGALIGSMFGPLGASVGWAIGAGLGGWLTAKGTEGPKLTDLRLQSSSYGMPIPICYGTVRAAGCVIWETDLVPHEHKTHGGKGGPSSTTTTYTASFAISLCEGPIIGILRIWADGRLVYGIGSTETDLPMTVYLGNETQLPDPTMEAAEGVGNVPAHRGMAYVVFTDMDMSPFFNRIPNFTFEIQVHNELALRFDKSWFVDWDVGDYDWNLYAHPQHLCGVVHNNDDTITLHRYRKGNAYGGGYTNNTALYYDQRTYDRDGNLLDEQDTVIIDFGTLSSPLGCWCCVNSGIAYAFWQYQRTCPDHPDGPTIFVNSFAWLKDGVITYTSLLEDQCALDTDHALHITGAPILFRDYLYAETEGYGDSAALDPTPSDEIILRRWPAPDGAVTGRTADIGIHFSADEYRTSYPLGFSASRANGISIGDDGNIYWMVNYFGGADGFRLFKLDTELTLLHTPWWTLSAETPALPLTGYTFTYWAGYLLFYAGGFIVAFPSFQLHRLNDDGSTTFIDELVVPTLNGEAVASDVISLHGGYALWTGGIIGMGVPGVPLSLIVGDVSDRVGYDELFGYDVSQLTDIVKGYTIGNRMTGRAAIDALRPIYQFGAVESNQLVKFRKWTGIIDAVVSTDDLGARPAGEDAGDPLGTTRAQEPELPRQIDAVFLNIGMDYQEGHALRQREVTESELDITLTMPVVLNDGEAIKAAEIVLFNAWMERDKFKFQLPRKWSHLEPTDVISLSGRSMRLMNKDEQGYTHIVFDAVATGVNVFVSAPSPVPPIGFVPQTVAAPNVTELRLYDLPLITDSDFPFGYYAATAGRASTSWSGATIFKSIDGGVSYNAIAASTQRYAMGRASTVLGDFDGGDVFDEMNTVTVVLTNGSPELESSNELGMLNGANFAMVADEIIQYRDATLVGTRTYQLSGLLRGRRGTEFAISTHTTNEAFAMLPLLNLEGPLAEIGQERLFKGVTTGQTVESVLSVAFTNNAVALRPYSPVELGGGRNGAGDITLNWVRRTRVGGAWLDNIDVPLGEDFEGYRLKFYTDSTYGTELISYLVSDAQTYIYLVADQTADFGSPQATLYWSVEQLGSYEYGPAARGVT